MSCNQLWKARAVLVRSPWIRALLRAERQALEHISRAKATEVVFYKYEDDLDGADFFDKIEDTAHEAGYVTSRVPVYREHAFDELAVLVRAVGRGLRWEGMKRGERGLATLLELTADRRGLRRALDEGPVGSEIFELARAYVRAQDQATREANRIAAWLSGSPEQEERAHLPPLTRRTAKRALADMTRLARVLGFKGTALIFEGADVISKLPDARREQSYIVLRELIDNADGGRGMSATRVIVGGSAALYDSPRSLRELEPLAMRVLAPKSLAPDALPHRSIHETREPRAWEPGPLPAIRKPREDVGPAMRAMLRASHSVPAPEAEVATTVAANALFHRFAVTGSVLFRTSPADHADHVALAPPHAERAQGSKGDRRARHARMVPNLGLDRQTPAREAKSLGQPQAREGQPDDWPLRIG